MSSCVLIYGNPGNGKTYAADILHKKLYGKWIQFDIIINFLSEFVRLKFGNVKPKKDFFKFFRSDSFLNDQEFNDFLNDVNRLISSNEEFFKTFYEKSVKNTTPLDDSNVNVKNRLGLGVVGDALEPFAIEIVDLVLKHIVKNSDFFFMEGYYFNEGKKYRKRIFEFCEKVSNLECFFAEKEKPFIYKYNGQGFSDLNEIAKKIMKDTKPIKKYQIFSENEEGGISPSYEKINKIGMPENLKGKCVLDIGCNEGFYCFECEKRGGKVIGIESNSEFIQLAIKRKSELSSFVNFKKLDWRKIKNLNYKFDLVLFLAAFHYIKNYQLEMLRDIYNLMNDGGLFILEVGLLDKDEGKFLIEDVPRPLSGDVCQFTNKFTIEKLVKDAGFSKIDFYGEGELLGDNIPRYTLHITK